MGVGVHQIALAVGALAVLTMAGCDGARPQQVPTRDGPPATSGVATSTTAHATATATSSSASRAPVAASSQPASTATASASVPVLPVEETPPVRRFVRQDRDRSTSGRMRMDAARRNKLDIVKGLFDAAGVTFPPRQLLLRGFKKENRLEVWASGDAKGPLTHVTTYEICYASGQLGPKRREGDQQVPEGYYRISWFKAKSSYHMAMQVSYPNTSDKILGHPREPGGEIMIHGDCVSIGCIAMSDDRIEEIWVAARAAPRPAVKVHIFPTRDMDGLLASGEHPEHHAFWRNIKVGFDRFQRDRILPGVRVERDGSYAFY